MKNPIRIYISHPIRGVKGKDATDEDMEANNQIASRFGEALQKQFPDVYFYVPAEHDEFVIRAYRAKFISEDQILKTDCLIIDECNAVLAYVPEGHISHGMQIEILHAQRTNKTVLFAMDGDALETVENYLEGLKR